MQIDRGSTSHRPDPEPLGPTPAGRADQEAARRREALKVHSPAEQKSESESPKVGRYLDAKA